MDITFDEKIAKQAGCAHIDNLCNKAKQAIIAEKPSHYLNNRR